MAGYSMSVISLAAGKALESAIARLNFFSHLSWLRESRSPDGLLLTPHDLRTGDATIASDLYRGTFSLGGKRIDIGAHSPFKVQPPSQVWLDELEGFSWLRHLSAADNDISRLHARALVADWIESRGYHKDRHSSAKVKARRLISWISHASIFLDDAEPDFYQSAMRSFGQQINTLNHSLARTRDGESRLVAAIALCFASLCLSGQDRLLNKSVKLIEKEIEWQILPDGGHISRHPGIILSLLLDLLPLQRTFSARDMSAPEALHRALDRMMPMIRFFRHGDGSFALFNGMGITKPGEAAAVLALDDIRGQPIQNAQHSGYQRLEGGRTVLIQDTGTPPPIQQSAAAHAGCLAFELSSGTQRIIINCGAARTMGANWRHAARATAAHSTVTLDDSSSAHFLSGRLAGYLGPLLISGPKQVHVAREEFGSETVVEASHNGYVNTHGVMHIRRLSLSRPGGKLEGEDRLTRSTASHPFSMRKKQHAALRFHLHPDVSAEPSKDGKSIHLMLANRERWQFSAVGGSPVLEDSVFLAGPQGKTATLQIVIQLEFDTEVMLKWSLQRIMAGHNEVLKAGRKKIDNPSLEKDLSA